MNSLPNLYPLKFIPILKQKVWGGNKLHSIYNKVAIDNLGESWEISGVEENVSHVSNGVLQGKTIHWLLDNYGEKLVGKNVYGQFGNQFPLLFKFIDAREDLSVQVHPNDFLAKKRHHSFGKTEMWYILDVEKDARLIIGFNREMDQQAYLHSLSENKLTEILNSEPVKNGDAFIIKPGTVHAIGQGVLLAEIQQTSDITYRIYDWDRPDTNGQMRKLHTAMALEAIDFQASEAKVEYADEENIPVSIGTTSFFTLNKLMLSKNQERDLQNIQSFTVYMCIDGHAIIETEGASEKISKGETILIPAQLTEIKFITNSATFLEVYIP